MCEKFENMPFPTELFFPLQKEEFSERMKKCKCCSFFCWPPGGSGGGGTPGPQGERGEKGERGADGADGAQGIQGERGERGEQGIQGIQGERGEQGPEPDLSDLYDRMSALEAHVEQLQNFVYTSEYTEVWSTDSRLLSLGVGVVRTGITHSFFGIGKLSHQQTLTSGTTYTLISASQYPPLTRYVGDATYAQMWMEASDRALISIPIHLDEVGIRFTMPSQQSNLPVGTLLRFTVALVLMPETL
jgi:hypothetical protein